MRSTHREAFFGNIKAAAVNARNNTLTYVSGEDAGPGGRAKLNSATMATAAKGASRANALRW